MKGYDFRTILATICPDYAIDTDNEGQLVIYTNLMEIDGDEYVKWKEAEFPEWGIKAVFIHNDTGHTKFDLYENGEAESEVTGTYPAMSGPYESEAEALEAINGWRGDLIAQAATIDTKNEEDLQGYYLDDLVPYLIEKE